MKITQRAEFVKGAIQSKRGRIDKSQCAIIEIDEVRFSSLTPNDESGADKINAATATAEADSRLLPWYSRIFKR